MAFVTGMMLIDAPASALQQRGARGRSAHGQHHRCQAHPYQSGRLSIPFCPGCALLAKDLSGAVRRRVERGTHVSEAKIAYTDANAPFYGGTMIFLAA